MSRDPKDVILKIVEEKQSVTVYDIAKALGVTYGTAQWYVYDLERRGLIRTVKIGKRRYVVLPDRDWLESVMVSDAVEELLRVLSAHGISGEMSLRRAIEILEHKAPQVADLLRRLASFSWESSW